MTESLADATKASMPLAGGTEPALRNIGSRDRHREANTRIFNALIRAGRFATPFICGLLWLGHPEALAKEPSSEAFRIWSSDAPGLGPVTSTESTTPAQGVNRLVRNVTVPTLTAFLPDAATRNGAAVVVAPGGSFKALAIDAEGNSIARRLQSEGFAAFVLKYRVEQTPNNDLQQSPEHGVDTTSKPEQQKGPDPDYVRAVENAVADGLQAMRVVRGRASEWDLDPHRIGILGFSAGGQVANAVASGYDTSSRPDFAASIYGVPSKYSVPKDAPPLFLAASADDRQAISGWNIALFRQWRAAGKSAELHLYSAGGHGFADLSQGTTSDHWFQEFFWWLKAQKMTK